MDKGAKAKARMEMARSGMAGLQAKALKNGVEIGSVKRKCQVKARWLDGGKSSRVLLESKGICIGICNGSNGKS